MKFYKRFPGDIMKKTSGLTMAQFGAYDRLMDWCYANEKPVDPLETYTITHAQTPADRRDVDRVLSKFFTLEADGYHQERIEEVIAEALPRIQAARENGKKGGRPITQPEPSGLFLGTEDEPKSKAIQEPVSRPLQDKPEEGSGSAPSAAPPTPPPAFDGKNAETLNGKAVVQIAAEFELPEQWGFDAEALGFQPPQVLNEGEKFRQYWTSGKGGGTRRSVKGWRQSWSNWLGKAAERQQR